MTNEQRIDQLEDEVDKLKEYIEEISSMMCLLQDIVTGNMSPYEFNGLGLYYLMKKKR